MEFEITRPAYELVLLSDDKAKADEAARVREAELTAQLDALSTASESSANEGDRAASLENELVQYASECDSLSETLAMTQASLASKQEARAGGGKGVEQRSVLQRQRVSL